MGKRPYEFVNNRSAKLLASSYVTETTIEGKEHND